MYQIDFLYWLLYMFQLLLVAVISTTYKIKNIYNNIVMSHQKIKILLINQSFLAVDNPLDAMIPEVFSFRQSIFASVPIVLYKSNFEFPRGPTLFAIISVFVHRRRFLPLDMFQSTFTELNRSFARVLINALPFKNVYPPIHTRYVTGCLVSFTRNVASNCTIIISGVVVADSW